MFVCGLFVSPVLCPPVDQGRPRLPQLHEVAEQAGDTQLCDFVESEFLEDQLDSIKSIADMVTQLERVGEGHGLWDWDQKLLA